MASSFFYFFLYFSFPRLSSFILQAPGDKPLPESLPSLVHEFRSLASSRISLRRVFRC
jgi:hypothetical protein